MAENRTYHYDAFISYRHAETDQSTAVGLHRRLESFRMPAGLRPDLPEEKRRIQRVFRDQDELPLSSNLSESIELALQNTDWLIVIATPRFPQSKWCAREIERFTELYGQDHILVVLAEGTPEESIPEVLRYRKNGAVDEIAADVRPEKQGDAGDSQLPKETAGRKQLLDEAALRIAARIFALDYEELKREVRERRIRRIAGASAGAAAVLLAFAVYCFSQFSRISAQKNTIETQYGELQELYAEQQRKYADSMVSTARQLAREGHRMDALYAICSALEPFGSGGTGQPAEADPPVSAPVMECLAELLGTYERNTLILEGEYKASPEKDPLLYETDTWLIYKYDFLEQFLFGAEIAGIAELEDGTVLCVSTDARLFLYDEKNMTMDHVTELWFADPPSGKVEEAIYLDDCLYLQFASYPMKTFACYRWKSIDGYEKKGEVRLKEVPAAKLTVLSEGQELRSTDGRYRLALGELGGLCIYEGEKNEPVRIFYDLEGMEHGFFGMEALGDSGNYLIIGDELCSWLLDPELEIIARIPGCFGYEPGKKALIQYGISRTLDHGTYPLYCNPLKSGEELVRDAKRVLGDYRPDAETAEKYRILFDRPGGVQR